MLVLVYRAVLPCVRGVRRERCSYRPVLRLLKVLKVPNGTSQEGKKKEREKKALVIFCPRKVAFEEKR